MNAEYTKGAAFCDGDFVPAGEAAISVLDWGFTRSDVTYDVVHVRDGSFFRLEDHLERFRRSMQSLRLQPPQSMAEIAAIAERCVALSGLRDAYVAMICTRGRPRIFGSRRPEDCDNRLIVYAIPWIDVIPLDVQARGAHLHIASVPRIAASSIDPTVKNYHWGDLTRGLFEAHDAGADTAVLLDGEGYVTEGPGFNIFAVKNSEVLTPDRGALEGITRRSVLELCEMLGIAARIAPLRREDLLSADEIFCTTTAGGVMPVSQIDDHIMSGGKPGAVSMRLKEFYWEQHRAGWHQTPVDYSK
jgi:branched-chain amino acid aminotransferase